MIFWKYYRAPGPTANSGHFILWHSIEILFQGQVSECTEWSLIKAVGESRVPVSRPKASSPGRKKLMLDTRKYKIFALFMWKLELPMIWDFPYSCTNYLANHRAPYLACGDRDISGYIIA